VTKISDRTLAGCCTKPFSSCVYVPRKNSQTGNTSTRSCAASKPSSCTLHLPTASVAFLDRDDDAGLGLLRALGANLALKIKRAKEAEAKLVSRANPRNTYNAAIVHTEEIADQPRASAKSTLLRSYSIFLTASSRRLRQSRRSFRTPSGPQKRTATISKDVEIAAQTKSSLSRQHRIHTRPADSAVPLCN
jgi:hypothetical protein